MITFLNGRGKREAGIFYFVSLIACRNLLLLCLVLFLRSALPLLLDYFLEWEREEKDGILYYASLLHVGIFGALFFFAR